MEEDNYIFVFTLKDLKDYLHIVSSFHIDGTFWGSPDNNYIELINIQNIKSRIIIPIISTNIKKVEYFKIPYLIEKYSIKSCNCDNIILSFSKDKTKLQIIGVHEKQTKINSLKFLDSISYNNIDDELDNFESINTELTNFPLNIDNNCNIKVTFIDNYDTEYNSSYISNSIDMSQYTNIKCYFIISYQHFINFINKTTFSKALQVKIENINSDIIFSSYNLNNNSINKLIINLENKIEGIEQFSILTKHFEPLKHINISMSSNLKKNKRIYNEILFQICKIENSYYLNVLPNNIFNTEFKYNTVFVSLPSV